MALLTAAVNVIRFHQSVGLPPFPAHLVVNRNHRYELSSKPFEDSKTAKFVWKFNICGILHVFALACWQLKSLFTNWDQLPDRMERMGIFIILLSASAISLTFLLALSHYQDEYCLNLTQLFKLDVSTGKYSHCANSSRQDANDRIETWCSSHIHCPISIWSN